MEVKLRRSLASVMLDMLPAGRTLDKQHCDDAVKMIAAYARPRSYFNGGPTIVACDTVPLEYAETLAAIFWAIGTAPYRVAE